MSIRHLLLTQFSIPAPQAPGRNRDVSWLRFRLHLLSVIGVPSVRSQTSSDFEWILMIDRHSGPWVLEELGRMLHGLPATLLPVGEDWKADLRAALLRRQGSSHLLTSQLDSDDAIAPQFIESVRAQARPGGVVNASVGSRLEYRTGRLVRLRKKRAFESVCSSDGRNIFDFHHGTAGIELPNRDLDEGPLWMQTIHGINLANRSMRGFPIADPWGTAWSSACIRSPSVADYFRWAAAEAHEFARRAHRAASAKVSASRSEEVLAAGSLRR